MVVVVSPLTGTGCSGALGRIGTRIGGPWLVPLDRSLVTSPGRAGLRCLAREQSVHILDLCASFR